MPFRWVPHVTYVFVPSPHRSVGAFEIVARPSDGTPLLLDPLVARVWLAAKGQTLTDLGEHVIVALQPTASRAELRDAYAAAISLLAEEGLLAEGHDGE